MKDELDASMPVTEASATDPGRQPLQIEPRSAPDESEALLEHVRAMGRVEVSVKRLLERAHAVQPSVRSMLERIVAKLGSGGRMEGSEFEFKPDERLFGKIFEMEAEHPDWAPHEVEAAVPDALRYTIIFNTDTYTQQVSATLDEIRAEGFTFATRDILNHWAEGNSYKGINAYIRAPDGFMFEVLFHTPASWEARQACRPLLEEIRSAPPYSPDASAAAAPQTAPGSDEPSQRTRYFMTETGGGLLRETRSNSSLSYSRLDRRHGWVNWSPLARYLLNGEPGIQRVTREVAEAEIKRWNAIAAGPPSDTTRVPKSSAVHTEGTAERDSILRDLEEIARELGGTVIDESGDR